jgi:hypothetical protein
MYKLKAASADWQYKYQGFMSRQWIWVTEGVDKILPTPPNPTFPTASTPFPKK